MTSLHSFPSLALRFSSPIHLFIFLCLLVCSSDRSEWFLWEVTVTQTRGNSITMATICSKHIRCKRACGRTQKRQMRMLLLLSIFFSRSRSFSFHLLLTRSAMAHVERKKNETSRSRHRNRQLRDVHPLTPLSCSDFLSFAKQALYGYVTASGWRSVMSCRWTCCQATAPSRWHRLHAPLTKVWLGLEITHRIDVGVLFLIIKSQIFSPLFTATNCVSGILLWTCCVFWNGFSSGKSLPQNADSLSHYKSYINQQWTHTVYIIPTHHCGECIKTCGGGRKPTDSNEIQMKPSTFCQY